jgi:hypothetical protein
MSSSIPTSGATGCPRCTTPPRVADQTELQWRLLGCDLFRAAGSVPESGSQTMEIPVKRFLKFRTPIARLTVIEKPFFLNDLRSY